ncbi:lamin tail domain-containing protein, partial [Pirellulales bacterium]|nr:lamin tail domain-containing protein [Pirellulales bacterium]
MSARTWTQTSQAPRAGRKRRLRFESLERRMMLDGAAISEFVAANSNGLLDEDGDASDWIEIHNPTAEMINLAGWRLSDNDNQLDKWTFPSVEIPPDGYLVVFASKKDRADVGSPLHTNFQLSSGGEYLALTQPDLTIASDFGPQFPTQFANTSYGLVANNSDTVLLDTNADVRALVPTDDSLGTSWTAAAGSFDDSAWAAGTTGVGFDLAPQQSPANLVGYWPLNDSAEDASGNGVDAILNGTTFATNVPGVIGAGASLQLDGADDSVDLGDVGLTSGSIAMWIYPTDVGAGLGSRRLLSQASGAIAQGGALGIDPNSTLGDGSVWVWDGGNWLRLTDNGVLQVDRWQHIALVADGGEISLYVDGVAHNTVASDFDFNGPNMLVGAPFLQIHGNPFAGNIDDLSLWDTALTTTEIASLAAGSPPLGLGGLSPLIGADLETSMHGVNASAYLRTEFEVADPASLGQLILQMKYDDAYVAYLNGQEVARQNVTGQPAWNQAADQPGADENVSQFQEVDITQHLSLLAPGTNVLAIHGLNASATDEDFLILPRLVDRDDRFLPGLVRYFSEPTPGAQNGVVTADIGPIISQVSEPAGALAATDPLLVTATVTPTFEGLDEVLLYY